ncbi:sodium/calcium exchanger 1-like [Orbicella faveolata]|uniref:sodium/calcium exchanger 1-like n=1 Tax=Orbicella faveolata TaxID=48498 RepID=UPI0009E47262|nr:sodium/calcium exchanger 1-like [Orbicella faveolata]
MPYVKRLALQTGIICALWCAFLQQTVYGADPTCELRTDCKPGIVLPVWGGNPSTGEIVGRAFVYLLALLFFFLGVSIISDRFMSAIEIITSKEKEIRITDKQTGKERVLTVKIWNETVSNLTLMALGSSAPEILLSAIEICGNDFNAGELGPSTIVGSAAFNLLIIIAVCVYVIPDGEVRRIKHLRVFAITASTSVLAYVWLYIILAVSSKDVVDIWEAVLTLAFFPIMVLAAYIADRKLLFYRALRKKRRKQIRGGLTVIQTGDFDVVGVQVKDGFVDGNLTDGRYEPNAAEGGGEFDNDELLHDLTEDRREKAIQALKDIRQKHPDADRETVERLLEQENLKLQPKSRAFYRIEATRKMVGSGNVLKMKHEKLEKASSSLADAKMEMQDIVYEDPQVVRVYFDPVHYIVKENCGSVFMNISRTGGDPSNTVFVDFRTEDGTAKAGEDYEKTEGTICFRPGESSKTFSVVIVDDDIFEEDEHFYVHLGNVRVAGADGDLVRNTYRGPAGKVGKDGVATVTILDDDYPGIFTFEEEKNSVTEADGVIKLKVIRHTGARGTVRVPYHTVEGTAKGGGEDYEDAVGELEFMNDETWKNIEINVIDDEEYEKNEIFYVVLGEPKVVKDEDDDSGAGTDISYDAEKERLEELGKPRLGDTSKAEVTIIESKEFKNTVDKLLVKANLALVVGTSSWKEQFVDALTVSGSGDDDESDEPTTPTYGDYMMHYLTVFWKLVFAIVPPTDIWGGWACFVASIVMIGLLTMIIGDVASHFGCTIGLADSVVAITFVALGTSLPDTFASKVAAVGDEYADSSIGNVTGSNSVNVFLGLGVAWSIAAIVKAAKGEKFDVPAGNLGFSVVVFCVTAVLAIGVMMLRRSKAVGGELGGAKAYKLPTSLFFCFLWGIYIILSSLQTYCHISVSF